IPAGEEVVDAVALLAAVPPCQPADQHEVKQDDEPVEPGHVRDISPLFCVRCRAARTPGWPRPPRNCTTLARRAAPPEGGRSAARRRSSRTGPGERRPGSRLIARRACNIV